MNNPILLSSLKHWKLAGVITFVMTLLAFFLAFVLSPVYRAEILLVPTINESRMESGMLVSRDAVGALASRFGLGGARSSSDGGPEVTATLRSRIFIQKFIEDEQLLPILFESKWDSAAGTWKQDIDQIPDMADAYRLFSQDVLDVRSDFQTGLVTVRIEWRDPRLAARWANELVARINTLMREKAITQAQASLKYLSSELTRSAPLEVQSSIYRLIEQNLTQVSMAQGRSEYAFRIIDPASTPSEEDIVSPNRPVIIVFGLLFGGFLGICCAIAVALFTTSRRASGAEA